MQYKGEFYLINTLEKAYFLGLLQADGAMLINKRAQSVCTKLKLKAEDKYLLDILHKKWEFFTLPKHEIHKSGKESYYIYSYNRDLYNDICMNGVLPRKSYENSNNSFMPDLDEDLFISYLLGLLDGDGTIQRDKFGHIRIDLVGKTENLFKEIIERLQRLNINSKLYYRKDKDYYMIRISDKLSVKTLINKFSKCPICLERKFKKYFNINWDLVPGYDTRKNKKPSPPKMG
jgi:DNA-binding transcriptional regulator WhiA